MSIPATYSATDLKTYVLRVLGEVAGVLGWDATTPDLDEVLTETLLAYGVTTLADATDIPKLRVLVRWQGWRAAVDALAGLYDVSDPVAAGTLTRSQVFAQAERRLAAAAIEAGPYAVDGTAGAYRVRITPVVRTNDPYARQPTRSEV